MVYVTGVRQPEERFWQTYTVASKQSARKSCFTRSLPLKHGIGGLTMTLNIDLFTAAVFFAIGFISGVAAALWGAVKAYGERRWKE
jgi:hypothetical protein